MSAAPEPTLARSSAVMVLGTLASRATGFLRNIALAAAVGIALVGDAYNVANTLPNILYDLLLGGVLSSVVVPLLVAAAQGDEDGGEAYAQRLITVVVLVLGVASALAALAAPVVIRLYAVSADPEQRRLATTFARYLLPQIVFYGLGATIGAILNTRGRYAEPMWTPVLNNLVVISTAVVFITLPGPERLTPGSITHAQTLTLAIGTTLGIVVQTLALLPGLRATGFRFRLRLGLKGTGLGSAARLAGWVLCYVVVNQLGLLVIVNLANAAARDSGSGFSAYIYAYTLFQLPYAVVSVSVITALLPRMSRSAVDGRLADVRSDLSSGLRLTAVVLLPAALGFLVLGPALATVVFAHGQVTVAGAEQIGAVLAAFAVGLVPFSAFQLQLRAFYAMRDTRTPALVNVVVNLVNVGVDVALYEILPPRDRVTGLALGFALSYVAGLALSSVLLRRRLTGLDGARVLRTTTRLLVAATLGAAVAAGLAASLRHVLYPGVGTSLVVVLAAGTAGLGVYVVAATRMRVRELTALTTGVRRRIGR